MVNGQVGVGEYGARFGGEPAAMLGAEVKIAGLGVLADGVKDVPPVVVKRGAAADATEETVSLRNIGQKNCYWSIFRSFS